MSFPSSNPKHLMTVLVEDYFQVGAFEKLIQERNWSNFEPRYEQNTRKALDLLDSYDTKATFFVLGWIADQNPGLVREIASRGHEVASRGYYHRSLKNLSPEELREDLRRTNAAIEAATGQKVVGYRSAEKLAFSRDSWIFDVLADEGMAYDASFMPSRRDARGLRYAHKVECESGDIWEFPYSTIDLGAGLLPISGGNYLRQIPFSLARHAISQWDRKSEQPFVFYFHVWELDPEQPRISAASLYNRLRHYRRLEKMDWVVRTMLESYKFQSIAGSLNIERTAPQGDSARPAETKPVAEADARRPETGVPLTVVVPCYNEQETLPYLKNTLSGVGNELADAGYDMRVIFVDDKSQDATLETMHSLFGDDANVTILEHEVNKGVAGAIMTGIHAAETEIVCSIDCDCTFDPFELPRMVPLLTEGVDMVTASPYHKDGGVRNVPGWRLLLSKGASFIYRRVLHSKLDSYTACFRVYRRSSMIGLELEETGYHGVAEMLGRLDLKGGTIVEFPTVLEVRLFGVSKMRTLNTIGGHVKLMSRLARMRALGNKPANIDHGERQVISAAPEEHPK